MKSKLLLVITVLILFSMESCRKTFSLSPITVTNSDTTAKGLLICFEQGTDLTGDTVTVIRYDTQKHPIYLIDSFRRDSVQGIYNVSGQLESVRQGTTWAHGYIDYTYNSAGQLSEISGSNGDHYIFGYVNGILANSTFSNGAGAGTPVEIRHHYVYTVTSGNITNIKEFNADSTILQTERQLTYSSQPNLFKTLLLFNIENQFGLDQMLDLIMFYNTNLPSTNTLYTDNTLTSTQTYTYVNNSSQKLGSLKNVTEYPPSSLGIFLPTNFNFSFIYK